MKKEIPYNLCELTAREEGWRLVDECTVGELHGLEHDVLYDMVFHRTPPFFNIEQKEPASANDWRALCAQQCITVHDETFRIPDDLSEEGKHLARKLRQWVVDRDVMTGSTGVEWFANYRAGGVFRAPAFQERFENVTAPDTAVMAVVFDGGPLAHLMNLSYEDYAGFDAITKWLNEQGYWFENYTHWWAWILKND